MDHKSQHAALAPRMLLFFRGAGRVCLCGRSQWEEPMGDWLEKARLERAGAVCVSCCCCGCVLRSETAWRSAVSGLGGCLKAVWDQMSGVLSGAGHEASVAF